MAGSAFKQTCPSCEAQVPIKDASLVGKKVECFQCKYRFVVEKPTGEAATAKPKAGKAKAKPTGAPAFDDGIDGIGETIAVDQGENAPGLKTEMLVADDGAGKSRRKLYLGLGLGGIGLVVLTLASVFILYKPSGPKKPSRPVTPIVKGDLPADPDDPDNADKDKDKIKKVEVKPEIKKKPAPRPRPEGVATPAGPELTNLLPGDAEHVFHGQFKTLFDFSSPFRSAGFLESGTFLDAYEKQLAEKIGFKLTDIDDLIRADRFTGDGWSFTIVHFRDFIDETALVEALGLTKEPTVGKFSYYKAKANPWLAHLGRIAIGVPHIARLLSPPTNRPLYVCVHDNQTVIFADEAPLKELLRNKKAFPLLTKPLGFETETEPAKIADLPRNTPYLTIDPALKLVLDRIEAVPQDSEDKALFSTATKFDAAKIPNLPPDFKGKTILRPRQVWDLTALLEDRRPPRIAVVGSGLLEMTVAQSYVYRSEFRCPQENDARDLMKEADEHLAPETTRWIERLIGLKLDNPAPDPAPKATAIAPPEKKDASRWTATLREQSVDIQVVLTMDKKMMENARVSALFMALAARAEIELGTEASPRHRLAKAGSLLGEQGLAAWDVPPGTYPPGTFKRKAVASRIGDAPAQRMSWMTGLLPYLGHDNLLRRVDSASSWKDPRNWLAARTMVPEFIDPSYPYSTRSVLVGGMGVSPAATHFVGIAGIGLDAADYERGDPATIAKRGVFGYDGSASLDEVKKGRGLSQTILMMQVPHDGVTGVSPWIAGGGATVRGVPEKDSIAPFILPNQERPGAIAVMADGSIRFIGKDIPDDVFKALCTIQGPGAEKFDFNLDPSFKRIPDPAMKAPAARTQTVEIKISPPPKILSGRSETAPPPKKVDAAK